MNRPEIPQVQCSLCFGRGYRTKNRKNGRPGVEVRTCAGCGGRGQRPEKPKRVPREVSR